MTMDAYEPKEIENKWQDRWYKEGFADPNPNGNTKGKHFALVEFPYPSGNLHVGHWYAFSVPDIRARFMRMQGYDVLYPIGFDSFGLPAENAAIKRGLDPKEWTDSNIATMKEQLRSMGAMFAWDGLVQTSQPEFYKWTQWMFARFFEKGLVYRDNTLVNWCPSCKTVLANEQVVNSECERCGTKVEKKEMKQWMLRITEYADRLIDDLDDLDWPEEIKSAQKNWIGRSSGAELAFEVKESPRHFVLIHGYQASPDLNYHQWLKTELEKRGHSVEIPALPNSNEPDPKEQAAYVLENCRIDKNTVLVGHSLGSNVVLRVLEQLESSIHRTVLVGGFIGAHFQKKKEREVVFDFEFDIPKIKKQAGQLVLLHGENEETISREQFEELKKTFGGSALVDTDIREHFRAKEEPAVLRATLPHIRVFTTRPDTLYGATYMVLAPEHELVQGLKYQIRNYSETIAYQQDAAAKTDLDRQQSKAKTGVQLEGVVAINPATGKEIPVWIADYVLAGYGTGAVMAVPAHDERDREFAEAFGLEVIQVVSDEEILVSSGQFSGLGSKEVKEKIVAHVGGKMVTTYKQRDWGISRQRYWGTPIPVVYDPAGNPHIVPEEHLPWLLPTDVDHTPDGTAPLARSAELRQRTVNIFGEGWTPEVDTMDAFVDSTWYFLRYIDPHNDQAFADLEKVKHWLPVDIYSGGSEHTTMHVLYSRFWYKALFDMGLVPTAEPYKRRMNRGLIMGPDGKKMSKSKGNVVDPDQEVARFGADSIRTYLAFVGPYNEIGHYPWNTDGLAGVRRFLEKIWRISSFVRADNNSELHKIVAETIQKVTEDLLVFKTNTAIAQMMTCATQLDRAEFVGKQQYEDILRLLAPFAPHIAEELWQHLGNTASIHASSWPEFDSEVLIADEQNVAIQINGKLRGEIVVRIGITEKELRDKILQIENIQKYVSDGSTIKRFIYVPGKLVSIVV